MRLLEVRVGWTRSGGGSWPSSWTSSWSRIDEAEPPDAFEVTFDVIYAGETWCRSVVWSSTAVAAGLERDERAVVGAARDALLELLAVEAAPVSFHLRLTTEGTHDPGPGDAGRLGLGRARRPAQGAARPGVFAA